MGRYLDLVREVQAGEVEPPVSTVSPSEVGIPTESTPTQRTDNADSSEFPSALDGHTVITILYEDDRAIIFVDDQNLVWRYPHAWNLASPAPWATRRGARIDATNGNYPWKQDEARKRKDREAHLPVRRVKYDGQPWMCAHCSQEVMIPWDHHAYVCHEYQEQKVTNRGGEMSETLKVGDRVRYIDVRSCTTKTMIGMVIPGMTGRIEGIDKTSVDVRIDEVSENRKNSEWAGHLLHHVVSDKSELLELIEEVPIDEQPMTLYVERVRELVTKEFAEPKGNEQEK